MVDLVDLVELERRLRLEGAERAHGLRRKGAAIHEEQDSPPQAGLHEAIRLVDHGDGLARTRGHGDQHLPPAIRDGSFDGRVGVDLVGPQPLVAVGIVDKPRASGVEVALQQLPERVGRVEPGDRPRRVQLVPNVVEPGDFAVGRVQERNAEATEIEAALREATGVALRLDENILRAEAELLGLDDPQDVAVRTQRVVCRALVGWVFLQGVVLIETRRPHRTLSNKVPTRIGETLVNSTLSGLPLRLLPFGHTHPP